MTVTENTARDAARELNLKFPEFDAEGVASAYRKLAKLAHPDQGGSLEAFVAIDRAKCILLAWIERNPEPKPSPGAGTKCLVCDGKGFVMQQRAWRALRVQCGACRGTGDLDSEHEKGE